LLCLIKLFGEYYQKNKEKDRQNNFASQKSGRNKKYQFKVRKKHCSFKIILLSIVGFVMTATAGLMVYIASDELIPSSCCRAISHSTIFGLIVGVLTVILLKHCEY
jgi:hypothetical protein